MKSIRKKLVTLFIIVISIISIGKCSLGFVSDTPKKLGLYNSGNGRKTGFYTSGTSNGTKPSIPVIKIIEYNSSGTGADENKANQAIYCLKDGLGFAIDETTGSSVVDYTQYFNLRDLDNMGDYINILPSEEDGEYGKLMWLLDNICIPEDEESVEKLLKQIGRSKSDFTDYMSEDEFKDVIEVIQQAAIWYITNKGDNYQPSEFATFKVATMNGGVGTDLDEKFEMDPSENPIKELYEYLIGEAQENSKYDFLSAISSGISLDSRRVTVDYDGLDIKVGPYKIEKRLDNFYNFNAKIYNGSIEIPEVTILKDNEPVQGSSTTEKIQSIIGSDFYLLLPYNTTSQVKIAVEADFDYRNLVYWSTNANTASKNQPVVVIQKDTLQYKADDTQYVEQQKTNVPVEKKWSDNENQDGIRPTSITVELLGNGAVKQEHVLNDENGWKYVFTGVPLKEAGQVITYTVREKQGTLPEGYTSAITGDSTSGFIITNSHTPAKTQVSVQKTWTDEQDQDSLRPTSITVELLSNGSSYQEYVLDEGNSWSHTFTDLPAKQNGHDITYTVREKNVPIGYVQSISGNATNGFTITNTHTPGFTQVSVRKEWNDGNNQDGIRPGNVTVELLADGTKEQEIQLNAENGWSHTFTNLPEKKNGIDVVYTVQEKDVPENYSQKLSGDAVYGFVITNSYTPKVTQVTVNKEWIDYNNKVGERPSSVTVELLANGSFSQEHELNEENHWSYTFTNLPVKQNGVDIVYTVQEKEETVPTSYESSVTGNATDGFKITNTYKKFDLALRKYITKINGKSLEELNIPERTPIINKNYLNSGTTAKYNHKKDPILVKNGDVVTYQIAIYNEGEKSGYASQIIDQLPTGLKFQKVNTLISKDSNGQDKNTYSVQYDETNNKITLDIQGQAKDLKAYKTDLDYEIIEISCLVDYKAQIGKKNILTNTAWISRDFDTQENKPGKDIDSSPSNNPNVNKDNMEDYKGKNTNPEDLSNKNYYYEGEQDDDDFEKLLVEKFDLALRKFITGVNDEKITSRVPSVNPSKYGTIIDNKEITDMEYTHPKDPVRVANNDIVIYTIRVYNEGTQSGYAAEIKDDIPEGLEFILDHEINQKYKWVLYDKDGKVTTNVKDAVTMRTDYLSKEGEEETGENLLKAFIPGETETPDYRDVQIAFRVTEPNTSDRIITNHAEISKDTDEDGEDVDDIDSIPDEWNEGEDDQDVEHLYVKYFDLALRKWISQVILIEDGVQKEMDTGHYAEQEPEPVVKVELNKKRIENTIVKFRYQIRITNEGEIEGYTTEISDYIPEGLKFNQADNPKWREVNGKIVTDQLKNTLLKPGETATVEVVLTWINGEDNLDVKTNVAEISEDDNPNDADDIDSTPNNQKKGEDDIDDASVVLTVVTGKAPMYIAIIAGITFIIGAGAFMIKKYVI